MSLCQEVLLVMHLVSAHFQPMPNDANLGGAVECRTEHGSMAFGSYRNSYNDTSLYAAVGRRFLRFGSVDIGGMAAGATGYQSPVTFIAGAQVFWQFAPRWELGALIVPNTKHESGLVHLTLSFRL